VPFLPKLLPGLEKVANEVADPECRSVAQRAHKELNRVGNEGKTVPPKKKDPAAVAAALKDLIAARQPKVASDEVFAVTLAYVGTLCAALQVRGGETGGLGVRRGSHAAAAARGLQERPLRLRQPRS
jgi:hypothetical protein